MKPLMVDLYGGLGGWAEGGLAEGYDVVGFDIERHEYGDHAYPAQLVIQDVLTLVGSQFRDATLIVASPPCQAYSYRAMPWKRAKALPPPCNALFATCFRIQREACEAAGHHIPLVVENVRGAQKWVGRARWNYGSFYLWGDVPALMPFTRNAAKVPGISWSGSDKPGYIARAFNGTAEQRLASGKGQNPDGRKQAAPADFVARQCRPDGFDGGDYWFQEGASRHGSKSPARKAASAMIAKIPTPLARWIAATYRPRDA